MGQWWSIDVKGTNNNVVLVHGSVRMHDDWAVAFRRLENVILREHERLRLIVALLIVLLLVILLVFVVFCCWRLIRRRPPQQLAIECNPSN